MFIIRTSAQLSVAALVVQPLLALSAAPASAAITVYTDQAAYEAALSSSFLNTFTETSGRKRNYTASGNGFTYGATQSGENPATIYTIGGILQTNFSSLDLIITSSSNNFNAIGGNFFQSDANGAFLAGPVSVTVGNGTGTVTEPVTPSSATVSSFRGFISNTTPITTLTVSGASGSLYNTLENLRVGSTSVVSAAAPEPGTIVLVLTAGVPVAGLIHRRKATKKN